MWWTPPKPTSDTCSISECLSLYSYHTYSALKPLTCRILICFTMVLFPDSPAPERKKERNIKDLLMLDMLWLPLYINIQSQFKHFLLKAGIKPQAEFRGQYDLMFITITLQKRQATDFKMCLLASCPFCTVRLQFCFYISSNEVLAQMITACLYVLWRQCYHTA